MYAVFETGGKQYRASAGDLLKVELLGSDDGATVTFDNISTSPVYLLAALMDPEDLLASAGVGLPAGTPMGIHGILTGAPVGIAIGDGDTVEVALQFDDLVRMP